MNAGVRHDAAAAQVAARREGGLASLGLDSFSKAPSAVHVSFACLLFEAFANDARPSVLDFYFFSRFGAFLSQRNCLVFPRSRRIIGNGLRYLSKNAASGL